MIQPTEKRNDFSTTTDIKKRKEELMREARYFNYIRFIEFEPLVKKILKYFNPNSTLSIVSWKSEKASKNSILK